MLPDCIALLVSGGVLLLVSGGVPYLQYILALLCLGDCTFEVLYIY